MLRPTGDMLRKSVLFRRLTADDRQRVLEVASLRHFRRGEVMFREGDPADTFLAIVDGRVKVFKAAPGGKEIILEIFGGGDPLGAVADRQARSRRHLCGHAADAAGTRRSHRDHDRDRDSHDEPLAEG